MNVICLAERSTVPVKPGQLPLRTRGDPAHMPGTPNHCLASGACLCARLRAHRGCINAPAESPDHLQQEDRSSGELGAAFPLHFSTVQGAAEACEKVNAAARTLSRIPAAGIAPMTLASRPPRTGRFSRLTVPGFAGPRVRRDFQLSELENWTRLGSCVTAPCMVSARDAGATASITPSASSTPAEGLAAPCVPPRRWRAAKPSGALQHAHTRSSTHTPPGW